MSTLTKILSEMYHQATRHPGASIRRILRNGLTIALRMDASMSGAGGDLRLAIYRHKQAASNLEMKIILQHMPPGSLPENVKHEPYTYGQYHGYLAVWQVPTCQSVQSA